MGICASKPLKPNPYAPESLEPSTTPGVVSKDEAEGSGKHLPIFPFYSPNSTHYLSSKKSPTLWSASSTPQRFFKRSFLPPSLAKHIKALLARRQGKKVAAIPEGVDEEAAAGGLDKSFESSKQFTSRYEVGEEVGRGHFGYTCSAWFKKPMPKGKEEFTATHSPLEEKGNMSRGLPDNVLWVGTFLLLSQLK